MTLKNAAQIHRINYNYLKNLWAKRSKGLPIRLERKKIDSITDFTSDQLSEIWKD